MYLTMLDWILWLAVGSAMWDLTGSNLVCQFDSSVPNPVYVMTVARCGPHEVCSMEQYITPSGDLRHNLRCKDRHQCHGVTSSQNTVICSECCDTDLCAASLCKNKGLPNNTNTPYCFHCDYPVKRPESCEHIRPCGSNEACSVTMLPTHEYEVKCKSKLSCAAAAAQPGQCTLCCGSQLCNDQCGYAGSASGSGPACVDDSICPGLKQNFLNNGRDVCQDPTMRTFCNSTCGLCPKTASTSAPTKPPATIGPTSSCQPNPCGTGTCAPHGPTFLCYCNAGYTGLHCEFEIRNCKDAMDHLVPSSPGTDIYTIRIGGKNENVRCDMTTDGGGWTVIMNRETSKLNFTRSSTEYALGFGEKWADFWLGLEDIHALTADGRLYQLRVELTRANGQKYYEVYDDFSVGPHPSFILHLGKASGTAGDSLQRHSGYGFTTVDVDRDSNQLSNCAEYLAGAWWFHDCYDSCLTCPYETPGTNQCRSMSWNTINYCEALKSARMLVRPM